MPTNNAAWQPAKKATSLVVKSAPYTRPSAKNIVIRNRAVAINPLEWMIQQKGDIMYTWLKYPTILGADLAGDVVEVGKDVTRFKVGDRVAGLARGTDEKDQSPVEAGFQEYPTLREDLTSQIPSTLSYENAAVIPLGLSTAAACLFEKDQLGLQYPVGNPKPAEKTLIVWGGSTSVGSNAIQLAVMAGYEVFTTCSPKNFEFCENLGASKVFDYKSNTVIPDMIKSFHGKTAAGALAIGTGAAEGCMTILDNVKGDKFVAMATYPVLQEEPKSLAFIRTAAYFVSWIVAYKAKGLTKGIRSNFIFGSSIAHNNIGKMIFEEFLPKALQTGTFVATPEPYVFGQGIENIQAAMDYQKKGVSAKKVVVTL